MKSKNLKGAAMSPEEKIREYMRKEYPMAKHINIDILIKERDFAIKLLKDIIERFELVDTIEPINKAKSFLKQTKESK